MLFQVVPKVACSKGCMITLAASYDFFPLWDLECIHILAGQVDVMLHIGCIYLTFLHCAFSNVSSNCLLVWMQSYIGCIYLTFLHCAFSNVSSNCLHEKGHSHIVRFPNRLAFFQVTLGPCLSWLHLLDFSPLCIFKCHFTLPACVDAKSHWLHLFDFSPRFVFKCLLKSLAKEDA